MTTLARRNAMVLAVAQALAGGNNTVIVATASIVGAVLAPDKGLATLPVTAMVFRHVARHAAAGRAWRGTSAGASPLQCGSAFGILSGLISYSAVMNGNFWLLLVGTFCGGLYAAAHQSYRFAAADTASDAYRSEGRILGTGGRRVRRHPRPAARHLHQGSCCRRISLRRAISGQSLCAIVAAAFVLQFVKVPPLSAAPITTAHGRSARSCATRFIVAVACGMASYAMMNMVMTSAPLAMVGCGHSDHRTRRSAFNGMCWRCMGRASLRAR